MATGTAGGSFKRVDGRTRFAIGGDFSTRVVNLSAPRKKTGLPRNRIAAAVLANTLLMNEGNAGPRLARVMHEPACNRLHRAAASWNASRAAGERLRWPFSNQ